MAGQSFGRVSPAAGTMIRITARTDRVVNGEDAVADPTRMSRQGFRLNSPPQDRGDVNSANAKSGNVVETICLTHEAPQCFCSPRPGSVPAFHATVNFSVLSRPPRSAKPAAKPMFPGISKFTLLVRWPIKSARPVFHK